MHVCRRSFCSTKSSILFRSWSCWVTFQVAGASYFVHSYELPGFVFYNQYWRITGSSMRLWWHRCITNIKTYIYLQVFAFGNSKLGQTGVRIGEPVGEPTEIYRGTGECHCIILLQGLSKSNLRCLYKNSLVSHGNNIFYHAMTEFKTPIYYFLL